MPTRPHPRELAALHDGVVSWSDLVASGWSRAKADDELKAGRWQRLLPGLYLTSPTGPTLRQRCHAALLHAGPSSVVSGRAGCELRGITVGANTDDEVVVIVPSDRHPVRTGFCHVVRTRQPPEYQLLHREDRVDLRVAMPARCVADAVRRAGDVAAGTSLACAALRHPGVHWDDLRSVSRRGPGTGPLVRVLRDLEDGVRSAAEGQVHAVLMRAAGRGQLPPYLFNPDLYLDGELLGSPDVWFPGLGVGDEIDSREWHERPDLLDATLQRHRRFAGAGLELLHVTPARFLTDPQAHVAELRATVAARGAMGTPEPPGLVVRARGPLLPSRAPWPTPSDRLWF